MEQRYVVLIVDDTEHNIALMSEMLKDSYDIITADNGTSALEIMRGAKRPDVVLLDMLMPKPDGYDVLAEMNADEELRAIPVVVITSDNDPNAQERAYGLGAVDFVSRGNDMNFIRYRVRSVLRLCELDKIRRENELLRREISSERRLSALMDNLPGGVAIIKTDGETAKCTYYNSELPQLFGMDANRFVMQFSVLPRPEWIDKFSEKARDLDDFTYDFPIGDKENPDLCQWIRVIAGGFGENSGTREMYCVFLDINAEKRQELRAEESGKRLRDNQTRLETVVNNAPGGISLSERVNGKFRTVFVNQGLTDMLGFASCEECLAHLSETPNFGVSENDIMVIRQKIADVPESGGHFTYAFRCAERSGDDLWVSMSCQLLRSEEDGRVKMYAFITDITKDKRYEHELRAAAYYDTLTGLYNRHAFMRNARRLIEDNPLMEFSLMKLNIGSFKVVNDLLGRDIGDRVLIEIANAVRELFRGRGVYARLFADNFVIITPYSERGVHPQTVLDTVQKAVAASGLLSHEIQYYIGVYRIIDRSLSVENMTDRASIACRSINGSFREHIAYYDENMRKQMLEEQQICDESHRALKNGEFSVYYQPVYGIKAKRFVSAEALVRWNHPTKGMINPGKFVPVFEKNGFIAELDLYVLEQVCKFMKRRKDEGLPDFPFSVNISRMSLYNPNLFETISELTDSYNIDPKYFRIEITESAYNDNPSQLLETIDKLRDKCYPVLMDDFGSGYSSLNTLKDIPIDILKLDMKFMQGFEKNGKVGTIVTSVARMSKWLNVPMLAEGVETKEQFDFLASVGCAYIQGFYFSRPVPEEELTRLIAEVEITGEVSVIEKHSLGEEVNELLGSNALVSKLISGAFGGFAIYEMYDNKLESIRVNEGYMKIMGYTPEDFRGENINVWDLMPPEDAKKSREACLEALKTDKAIHTVVRRYDKNGNLLYLDGVHRKLGGTDENPIFCIAFNDITGLLASERRVDSSKTEIEEILNATCAAIADIDFENDTLFYAGDMSDYGIELSRVKEYFENKDISSCTVHPDDFERSLRVFDISRAGKITEELRLINKIDGNYYWWRFTVVRSIDREKKIDRLIGVASFIDPERRAKSALELERSHMDAVMSRVDAGILMVEVTDDHNAHIIYSNESFWRSIGQKKMSDEEFFGSIYTGLSEQDQKEIDEEVKNGGTANKRYHITRGNGENAVLELTVGLSRVEKNICVYMIVLSDVTEQHNERLKQEAIVRNFHDGLALVKKNVNGIEITYANDKFYSVLDVSPENQQRVNSLLETAVNSGLQTSDVRIKHGDVHRTVRVSVDEISRQSVDTTNYVVAVSDVTLIRAESQNRIAERNANASAGLYDQVVELNYREKTATLIYYRRDPKRAENAKPNPLDTIIVGWGTKYVAPNDYEKFKRFITAPANDPDFTDSYCELSVLDGGDGDGEYHTLGISLVRSHGDVCVMFIRDRARFDDSLTTAQVKEVYRLYKLIAEQTYTTVIEIDHVENRISCSPSIKEFWVSNFSFEEFSKYEFVKQGLIVLPEDKAKYESFMTELYKSEEPQEVTLRLKMADGSYKWCRMTVSLSRGKDGRVLASLCTINLVHDEVMAQERAARYDALLRRTVAHIPVGVGVYTVEDERLVSVYVSDCMLDLMNVKNDDECCRAVEAFIEKDKIDVKSGLEGVKVSKNTTSEGGERWVSARYRVVEENGELIMYMAVADISDRIEDRQFE